MRNVELHVLQTNGDVSLGIQAGLLDETDVQDAECAACSDVVGHIAGTYFPFAVALDDQSQWLVCEDCASNVLDTSPYVVDKPDDDYELFSFDDE